MKAYRPFKIDTKRGLECLYDGLYLAGKKILKEHNPCKIKKTGEKITNLYNGKVVEKVTCINRKMTLGVCCCEGCEHLESDGCFAKCLGCKLFLCITAKKNKKAEKRLYVLRTIARCYNIAWCYLSKETIIERSWQCKDEWPILAIANGR